MYTQVPSLKRGLSQQIEELRTRLELFCPQHDLAGIVLIGSCSRQHATYRSDIDLLGILNSGPLHFSRVQQLRDALEKLIDRELLSQPLPVEIHFVLSDVFHTQEPEMRKALKDGIILVDYSGALKQKQNELKAA